MCNELQCAEPVGSLDLCRSGVLLLTLKSGIRRFNSNNGTLNLTAAPEHDHPMNRLNDGKQAARDVGMARCPRQ
ncbi:hypothetical protein [Falsiroseomonas sp. E2-1-a20]|uniref:hypothetical protein n=1 Tax=Falsiroseomonas sp. E2-1-a20 TaxID=3239300 RepID=UPI003F316924